MPEKFLGAQDAEPLPVHSRAVIFQHGNTNSLSFPAVIQERAEDIADVVVLTPGGPVVQYGVRLIETPSQGQPNTCWPLPEDISDDDLRNKLLSTYGASRKINLDFIISLLRQPTEDMCKANYTL